MSMCGEIENLQREIQQKKLELEALQRRLRELEELVKQPC